MTTCAIIPARGGSRGIPRKNVRPLAGKPLIAHTIEHARQACSVDRVVVSTDDKVFDLVLRKYQMAHVMASALYVVARKRA